MPHQATCPVVYGWRPLCPKICLLAGPIRCAPEKCKSFTVSGSPGVLVDVPNTVQAGSGEEAAPTRWPLSHPIDVLVKMTAPSSAIDGDKVSLGVEVRENPLAGGEVNPTPRGSLLGAGVSLGPQVCEPCSCFACHSVLASEL